MSGKDFILRCPDDRRAEALRVLHAGLPRDLQAALVHVLHAVHDQDNSTVFDGLLIATTPDNLVGAAWAQLTAGKTAVVWPPDNQSPAAGDLMKAVGDYLDKHTVVLAQMVMSESDTLSPQVLEMGDFRQLAKLAYLAVEKDLFPKTQPESRLAFQAGAYAEPQRLGELLLRTYEGSLDCPTLNGMRNMPDVLQGYGEQGTFAPERWLFVQQDGNDVGVLLLTAYEDLGNWEIVYMALLPEARGTGLGKEILRQAMWQAGQGGAERLVLAVDEANRFALSLYEQVGFTAWDHRTVYARLRP